MEESMDTPQSPKHYKKGGIEVRDIWKAKLTKEELKGLYKGNILKYIIRADYKNRVEDYKKAKVYLDWLIEECKEESDKK